MSFKLSRSLISIPSSVWEKVAIAASEVEFVDPRRAFFQLDLGFSFTRSTSACPVEVSSLGSDRGVPVAGTAVCAPIVESGIGSSCREGGTSPEGAVIQELRFKCGEGGRVAEGRWERILFYFVMFTSVKLWSGNVESTGRTYSGNIFASLRGNLVIYYKIKSLSVKLHSLNYLAISLIL
ncbi:hypothetical protein SUGI_0511900 [Cryptomeria japonica]|nr:hypothetical protein SUGI_0511900 [Cryptomeria japonica]